MKLRKLIAMLLVPLVCLLNVPVTALAADSPKVKTKITHKPIKEAVSGQRITLETKIKDPQGVDVVRAYFKSAQADDYHFVVMENTAKNEYVGTLPAPSNGAESIEYLILVKNGANQVVKTQTYRIPVKENKEDTAATAVSADKVQVYTELADAPQEIVGFTDSMAVDTVESAVKFGYVAGIYHGVEAASASAATGAATAGTVAAGTSAIGIGTIAVGAAVVAGGVAAASSGGSSDSSGSTTPADSTPADSTPADSTPADSTPADSTPADPTINMVGNWTGNLYFTSSYGFSCRYHINMNLYSNGTGNLYSVASSSNSSNCDPTDSTSGRWEINRGGDLVLRDLVYGDTITVASNNFNASLIQLDNYPYDSGSIDVTVSK